MTLTQLLQSLPATARSSSEADRRAVVTMQPFWTLLDGRLSALPPILAALVAQELHFQDRQARLTGQTIEALNSLSGVYTPLFTLA